MSAYSRAWKGSRGQTTPPHGVCGALDGEGVWGWASLRGLMQGLEALPLSAKETSKDTMGICHWTAVAQTKEGG